MSIDTGYDHARIKRQAQSRWAAKNKSHIAKADGSGEFCCQAMFADLAGKFHLGHCRRYVLNDIMTRFQLMQGRNTKQVVGFETYGLQVHLAARDANLDPEKWAVETTAHAVTTLKELGILTDWNKIVVTNSAQQCHMQQQLFLHLWNAENSPILRKKQPGIAYWDPGTRMYLSLRQLVNGRGPESGMLTEIRNISNYALSISHQLADDLLQNLETLPRWDRRVKNMQRESIGRENGLTISFDLLDRNGKPLPAVQVFTSHPDTIMGTTFLAVATTHPLARKVARDDPQIATFCEAVNHPNYAIEKLAEDKRQEGMPLGIYAINPVTGDHVPVWVANYVIADYGTSAVLGIPAHDQRNYNFAQRHNLPMRKVARTSDQDIAAPLTKPLVDKFALVCNSGSLEQPLNRLKKALQNELQSRQPQDGSNPDTLIRQRYFDQQINLCIHDLLTKRDIKVSPTAVSRLRSWPISQPDYWGCPVPLVHCSQCGTVPVPGEQLPLTLPQYRDNQDSLDCYPDFIACVCPQCGADAQRETDTLDPSFSLSWMSQSKNMTNAKLPDASLDYYCCGAEQATSHLLCARILQHLLARSGVEQNETFDEPFTEVFSPGMVMNYGLPMTKSYANAIDPTQLLDNYGADMLRLYLSAIENPRNNLHWDSDKLISLQGIIISSELVKLRCGTLTGLQLDLVHNLLSKSEINRLQKGLINRSEFKQLKTGKLEASKYAQVKELIGEGAIIRLQSGLLNEAQARQLRNGELENAKLREVLTIIDEFQLNHLRNGLLDKNEFRLLQIGKLAGKKLSAVQKLVPAKVLSELQTNSIDPDEPGAVSTLQERLLDNFEREAWLEYTTEVEMLRKVRTILTEDEISCMQKGLLNQQEFAALRAKKLPEEKMARVRAILNDNEILRLQEGLLSREEIFQLKAGKLAAKRLHAVLEIIDEKQIKQLQNGVLQPSEHEQLRKILGSSRKMAQLRAGTLGEDKLRQIREQFTANQLERYQQACLSADTMARLANFISTAQMNRLVNFVSDVKQKQLKKVLSVKQLKLLRQRKLGKQLRFPLLKFIDQRLENKLFNFLTKQAQERLFDYLPYERMEQLLGFSEYLWQLVTSRQKMIIQGSKSRSGTQSARRCQLHKTLKAINACYTPESHNADKSEAGGMELNKMVTRCKDIIVLLDEACDPDEADDCAFASEAVTILLQVLHPIMPHITEELWAMLQMPQLLVETPWPQPDQAALEFFTDVTCIIQENGRKRHAFSLSASADPATTIELASAELNELAIRQGHCGFPSLGKQVVRIEHAKKQDQIVINFVLYLHN